MRRTYRSKKETACGIDRRDLFQNLDEKSSAYDAFSIQNIKQTKRELSVFGSSNPLGVTSNRVRKKKYVKRIVKNAGTPCRDYTSPTAYLTPDKSIRVTKPLDPFDLLLMSSPSCPAESVEKKTESVTSKVDLYDQLVPKKKGRTYTRNRPKIAKKCNYSSNTESSDSDKENSDNRLNSSHNTSDIQTHKLLVEQKVKTPSRKIDESINNIVYNLSLFNELKKKCNTDDSFNNFLRMNRHRLTRNIQSPILQKFPLCSTPFKVKSRGESIFKFSPIAATNVDKSPTYITRAELNDSKSSIIALNAEKVNSPKVIEEPCHKSSQELVPVDNIPDAVSDEILPPEKEADVVDKLNIEKPDKVLQVSDIVGNANPSIELSSFQTSENELFIGFSQSAFNKINAQNDNHAVNKYLDNSVDRNDITEKEINVNNSNPKEASLNDTKPANDVTQLEVVDNSNCFYKNDSDIKQESFVNESAPEYNKSQFDDDKNSHCSEENLNNSDERNSNSLSLQSEDDDKDSLYDTCASDQSSIQEGGVIKEPVVSLQRMNDSLFAKYNDKINAEITVSDEKEISLHSGFASFNDSNDSKQSDKDISEIENEADNVSENETNDCDYEVESNEEEKSSSNNEEEQCISFVTTRRRNDATNNSIMSMFNDTCGSSGTDCDRTVFSINKSEKADIKDNIINIDDTLTYYEARNTRNVDKVIDLNKDSEHSNDLVEEHDTRISFVPRSSNVTDRKSSIKARKRSINPRNSIILSQSTILPRKTVTQDPESSRMSCIDTKSGIVLQPGKKWERSLSIYRRMTIMTDHFDESILDDICTEKKGRMYRQSIISTMEMQDFNSSLHNDSINNRRTTLVSKPSRSTIRIVKDPNKSRLSFCNTTVFDDLTVTNESVATHSINVIKIVRHTCRTIDLICCVLKESPKYHEVLINGIINWLILLF